METVKIELTPDQAAAVSRMLDLAVRINLCQFREIEHLARMGSIKHRLGHELGPDDWSHIDAYANRLASVFGFDNSSSFGVGSPHLSKDVHRGYELKKVLDKALAEWRQPKPSFRGVNYDGLLVRYTDDPAPVAVVE